MTDSFFFDTDCISAFLWVKEQSILSKLYPGHIIIPEQVYKELSDPHIEHLRKRLDTMFANQEATRMKIEGNTETYELYKKLMWNPDSDFIPIGSGEAAAIALAKEYSGILASNNLRDIKQYVELFHLRHITTADIMKKAYEEKLITENEGNKIWKDMLDRRRKLGFKSFSEVLQQNKNS